MPRDDLVLFEEVEASGGKRLGRIILEKVRLTVGLRLKKKRLRLKRNVR